MKREQLEYLEASHLVWDRQTMSEEEWLRENACPRGLFNKFENEEYRFVDPYIVVMSGGSKIVYYSKKWLAKQIKHGSSR